MRITFAFYPPKQSLRVLFMSSVSPFASPFNPILEDFLEIDDDFYPSIAFDHDAESLSASPSTTPSEPSIEQDDDLQQDDCKTSQMSRAEIRRENNRLSAQRSRERKQKELDRLQRIDTVLNDLVEKLSSITPVNPSFTSDLIKLKALFKTDKVSALKVLTSLFLEAIR